MTTISIFRHETLKLSQNCTHAFNSKSPHPPESTVTLLSESKMRNVRRKPNRWPVAIIIFADNIVLLFLFTKRQIGPHVASEWFCFSVCLWWRVMPWERNASVCSSTCTVKPERVWKAAGSSRADQTASPASEQMSEPGRVQMVPASSEGKVRVTQWVKLDPSRKLAQAAGLHSSAGIISIKAPAGSWRDYNGVYRAGHMRSHMVRCHVTQRWQTGVTITALSQKQLTFFTQRSQ